MTRILLLCMAVLSVARVARADCKVNPSDTGYSCVGFETQDFTPAPTANRTADNFIYLPATPRLHDGHRVLLLFLPGTGSSVADYKRFQAEAARRGYYVIGLAYRNDRHSPDLTGFWPNAAGNLHQQNVMGEYNSFYVDDHHNGKPAASNAINYRLGMLLTHLNVQHVGGIDWGEFWDESAAYTTQEGFFFNGQPFWSRMVVAGHSQGGEVATWITKNKPVIAGFPFNAPYATLNNCHTCNASDPDQTNGPPHVWRNSQDETTKWTGWARTGGQPASDWTMANFLDGTTWSDARRARLFITLDKRDKGYLGALDPQSNAQWPGHNMWAAGIHVLDHGPTEITACPANVTSQYFTFIENGSCSGHGSTVNDGCTPSYATCYYDRLLDNALALP